MEKQEIKARRLSRKLALQALYQWLMSKNQLTDIEAQVRALSTAEKMDEIYFKRLIYGVDQYLEEIEAAFIPFLDRPVEQLNPVEHTILRMCSFELLFVPEIPFRVVLDESILLARTFGSQEGHRYVNGVLDSLGKQVRAVEANG